MSILSLHISLTWNVIPLCIHPVSPVRAISNQHVQVRNCDAGMWSFLIRLILSYIYKTLCIHHVFTFRNHGFQTSDKCVRARGSIQSKCSEFGLEISLCQTAAKGEKASKMGDSRGLSEGCLHTHPWLSFA